MGEALAASAPPENQDAATEEPGARSQRDRGVAAQPRAVEEDRLGRQVFEPSAAGDRKVLRDLGRRAGRAIDFFRGRGGYMDDSAGFEADGQADAVAGDEPARGGDQYREAGVTRLRSRKQHPHRMALVEMR